MRLKVRTAELRTDSGCSFISLPFYSYSLLFSKRILELYLLLLARLPPANPNTHLLDLLNVRGRAGQRRRKSSNISLGFNNFSIVYYSTRIENLGISISEVLLSGPATQIGQTQVRRLQGWISELYKVTENEVQAEQPSVESQTRAVNGQPVEEDDLRHNPDS